MKNKAVIAGILSIISGAFSALGVLIMIVYAALFYFILKTPSAKADSSSEMVLTVFMIVFCIIGVVLALLGALGIVGGILSIKRKKWGVALAGSIAGAITCLPCGVAAIVFTAMAKSEFNTPVQIQSTQEIPAPEPAVEKSKGNKAVISGILTIVSGAIGVMQLGIYILCVYFFDSMMNTARYPDAFTKDFMQIFPAIYYSMGIYHAALGIIAIVFGVFALKRIRWGFSLAGAILATLTFYPCGIPAVILMAISQNEFKTGGDKKLAAD
jgi:hypothetical protein